MNGGMVTYVIGQRKEAETEGGREGGDKEWGNEENVRGEKKRQTKQNECLRHVLRHPTACFYFPPIWSTLRSIRSFLDGCRRVGSSEFSRVSACTPLSS